jgi:hypothetical protein
LRLRLHLRFASPSQTPECLHALLKLPQPLQLLHFLLRLDTLSELLLPHLCFQCLCVLAQE